jgi:hypothetical protein
MGDELFYDGYGWTQWFTFDVDAFLDIAGTNPFAAMAYLLLKGGWLIFIFLFFYMVKYGWLNYIQNKTGAKKEWILLRIIVPKASEQTCKAVENIFASFAGAHSPASWTEKWVQGVTQSPISIEIASIEGRVNYYVRSERRLRDLVEAAIYAQYPDAEIDEVEDYARVPPVKYPDDEWDLWGTEMIPVQKNDAYSLKTYPEFEDAISGEFKDPLAALLENFSRLGPGEQAWFQIVLTPTDQKDARARADKLMNKLKGIKEKPKRTVLDEVVDLPIKATQTLAAGLLGGGGESSKKEKKEEFPRMMILSPGERYILEAVERKAGKIGFMSKMRFLYVGKKEMMKKPKVVNPFIGAIKQMNTFHMQALKPESKKVGVNSTLWWFKDKRNAKRKEHLMRMYRNRSNWSGMSNYFLSSEELATFWHFPIFMQVKAPGTGRTEAKRSEPPSNIPFG